MTPIEVLNEKGVKDSMEHLKQIDGYDREKRLLAVFAARKVQHLMPPISVNAIDVAEKYTNGLATEQELENAYAAARAADIDAFAVHRDAPYASDAYYTTRVAYNAANAAANAAMPCNASRTAVYAAADAYSTAAATAAAKAAYADARADAYAAAVAATAARADAFTAARADYWQSIEAKFRELFEGK